MLEDKLIGFDVRELWLDPDELWDSGRREIFLLRRDVRRPLSVDNMVWASVFDTGQGIGFDPAERARLHLAGLPLPDWIGPNGGLWENLERMRGYLAANWPKPKPHAIVAISWLSDRGFAEAGPVGPYVNPTTPGAADPGWQRLGYDVADGSLVSGLSNCGYSHEEAGSLRARWAGLLNCRHLFADPAPALQFRDFANARVPEHAPFLVYGLYVVEEISLA